MKKEKVNKLVIYILSFLNFSLLSLNAISEWREPLNLSVINTKGNDYGLIYNKFDNMIYLTSDKNGYAYIYRSKIENDTFVVPELIKNDINQSKNNQAYFVPESNNSAFITTFRLNDKRPYQNIFKSRYQKQSWTLPYCSETFKDDSYNGMVTISADGSRIIFISNRLNENGDTDLWTAIRSNNGEWGAFSQIERLNSTGNEITPFLKGNDTLYFASDGYGGPGGFDVFISIKELGQWQRPKPITEINTEFNESDFVILPNNEAVFTSDRPGGKGGLDLYILKQNNEIINNQLISEYKLNLSAQVPLIRVARIKSTKTIPLITEINPEPDELSKLMLKAIAERMQKDAKITVKINSVNQSGKIVDIFNEYNIQRERIELLNPGVASQELISISFNNDEILQPVKVEEYSYSFEPSVLELTMDARPREDIDNWELKLLEDQNDSLLMKHNRLPATIFYKLDAKTNQYRSFDSINFIFYDKSDTSKNTQLKLPYQISDINRYNIEIIDNIPYFVYNIILNSDKNLNSAAFDKFKKILELHNTDQIIIEYKNEKYLDSIKKYIEDIFDNLKPETKNVDFENIFNSGIEYRILIKK